MIRMLGDGPPNRLIDSYTEWKALEKQTGHPLLVQTSLLNFGPPGDPYLEKHAEVVRGAHCPVEWLTADEVAQRFPSIRYPPEWSAVSDPSGLILIST